MQGRLFERDIYTENSSRPLTRVKRVVRYSSAFEPRALFQAIGR